MRALLLICFLCFAVLVSARPVFSSDEGYSATAESSWSDDQEATSPALYKGFSSELFWKMSAQLQKFHTTVYPGLMQSFGGFIRIFVILYILLAGYGIAANMFKEATKQMTISIGLVILLHSLIMESNAYSTTITPMITGFFMNFADFFTVKALAAGGMTGATDSFSVFTALDEMMGRLDYATRAIEASSGALEFVRAKMWFAIFTLTVIYAFLYGAFMALMVMGFFSLHILYLVGGICIFFAAFNQTRFIFYSWVRGIFNYGLLIVFASIMISICIFGLNESLSALIDSAQRSNEVFTREYFFAVFWALVSIALMLKAPDFAAMFSGGSAGSTAGIAAGMGLVTGAIAKGVKTGMKPTGKFAGNLMDRGLSNMPGGAGRAYSTLKGIYKGEGK